MDELSMDTRTESNSYNLNQYEDSAYDFSSEYKLENSDLKRDLEYSNADSKTLNGTFSFMETIQTYDESNEFRTLIVSLGLILLSVGILSNLLFNLLIICYKRKRKTSSTLIMSSICLAYILFFIFYCFKIIVYFNVETIIKFHNYDVTENWIFGSFLCKFVHAMPIWCKIFTRLSILTLIAMRILSLLIRKNCISSSKISKDANTNIIKDKSRKSILGLGFIKKCFECPALLVIIGLIWIISFLASTPLFLSYKLNHVTDPPICDSVYQFPDDIKKVIKLYLNYFIYGLIVPCSLILIFLIILSLCQDSQVPSHLNNTKKSKSINTVNANETKSNNFMLWLIVIVHLCTSFPQELYRYLQLVNTDINDPAYFEMVLLKPLTLAKPYYLIQMLYISEFAIIPIIFLMFLACSSKLENANSNFDQKNKHKLTRILNFCCYDYNLVGTTDTSEKNLFNNTTDQSINDALLGNHNGEFKNANGMQNHEIPIEKDPSFYDANNQNVLHIIQHPSWRINIKQQGNSSGKKTRVNNYANETNGSVKLPFNYMKSNM